PGDYAQDGLFVRPYHIGDLRSHRLDGGRVERSDYCIRVLNSRRDAAGGDGTSQVVVSLVAAASQVLESGAGVLYRRIPAILQAQPEVTVRLVALGNGKAESRQQVAGDVKGRVVGATDRRPPVLFLSRRGKPAGLRQKLTRIHEVK